MKTIKPEKVITQLINEMRILIQEMKTIRTIVTENKLFKKNSTNHKTQTKSNKNPKAPSFAVVSIAKPPQTSPYGKAIKKPPPADRGMAQNYNLKK